MLNDQNISHYRDRLDQTLASHDLVNELMITTLLKKQLLHSTIYENQGCIDDVLKKRTIEVSNFLEMLRSASGPDRMLKCQSKQHAEWKLKQDTEDCRVMYREGLNGSPFHTLLAEGYVDAPLDVCLCISWESALYKKWWPQFNIPTFKIISSKSLQKAQTGEQISFMRVKLSWPLSDRGAVLNYFEFPYFQDDLIIVIINSMPDFKTFDELGDERKAEEKDMIKLDIIGGFALQKVSSERSYFRTIFNMDIKMEFVPPSFINFVSRQLIGNGFRLYQKAAASVSKGDKDFSAALDDPLYAQIREAFYLNNVQQKAEDSENRDLIDTEIVDHDPAIESSPVIVEKCGEIEEELENNRWLRPSRIENVGEEKMGENCYMNHDRNRMVVIRPEAMEGLKKLEKMISAVRNDGFRAQNVKDLLSSASSKEGGDIEMGDGCNGNSNGGYEEKIASAELEDRRKRKGGFLCCFFSG